MTLIIGVGKPLYLSIYPSISLSLSLSLSLYIYIYYITLVQLLSNDMSSLIIIKHGIADKQNMSIIAKFH